MTDDDLLSQLLWEKSFIVEGERYVAQWRKSGYGARGLLLSDAYLTVSHAHSEQMVMSEEVETYIKTQVRETRIAELQKELHIVEPNHDPDIAWNIIQRVWKQEYMGQWNNSYFFMHFELAAIMKLDELEAMSVVETLHSKKLVGLNGAIIVPFEVEQEAFAYWEKVTGHKLLTDSGTGYWACAYCGHGGEHQIPGESTSDFPCTHQNFSKST